MAEPEPYKISIPQDRLDRLQQKLALTELPSDVDGAQPWTRGVPLSDIKRILNHWQTSYSWRTAEDSLNTSLPQFTTTLSHPSSNSKPYNVHFIHARSSNPNAIPLLFLHGWPGNFLEVTKILPRLINPNDPSQPAFHVVAPSLLNFGFSSASNHDGFNDTSHGHICHALMQQLGYKRYVIQGGDLGMFIARRMVQHYRTSIGGHLLNIANPREPTKERDPDLWERIQNTPLTDEEERGLKLGPEFQKEGSGYWAIQATRPLTLGYSLTDSPVGLLAWIYDKLHNWSDKYPWTDDEIITWVSIYLFSTPGPTASTQIYYDATHTFDEPAGDNWSSVPLGLSRFPVELGLRPKLWHETLGPVVFWSVHEKGGHFAAWERPDDLVGDLRQMFGRDGACGGCCGRGATGYDE